MPLRLVRAVPGLISLLLLVPATAHAGLVARWPFDEGAGNVAHDTSGSRLDGRLEATQPPAWIAGVEGTALRFGGRGGVRLPDSPRFEPPALTIAAWVRDTGTPGAYRYIFSKGGSSCFRSSYALYTGTGGGAAFYVAGDGAYTISPAVAPERIWDGRWHRLVGTYDGTTVRLYVDGAQVRRGVAGPTHVDYDLAGRIPYIGTYEGSCALPFAGDIDAPSLWSDALSASRLIADATPPAPPGGKPGPPGTPNPPPGTPNPPTGQAPPSGPVGRAPGHPSVNTGSSRGVTLTPPNCVSVRVGRRSVRVGHRTRLGVTVHRGAKRLRRARVLLRARRLHKSLRTNRRGHGRFVVRARRRQHRLTVRVAAHRPAGCGKPTAFVRVRPHHRHHRHHGAAR